MHYCKSLNVGYCLVITYKAPHRYIFWMCVLLSLTVCWLFPELGLKIKNQNLFYFLLSLVYVFLLDRPIQLKTFQESLIFPCASELMFCLFLCVISVDPILFCCSCVNWFYCDVTPSPSNSRLLISVTDWNCKHNVFNVHLLSSLLVVILFSASTQVLYVL